MKQLKNLKKEEEGFTLVELIVVCVIMAILAQIGLVSFNRYTRRTRAFAARTALRNIKSECEMNRDLGMDAIFTPLTPRGYSLQSRNTNSCLGQAGSGLVSAIPDNPDEYPSYFYDFGEGNISCKYSSTTDDLFNECKPNNTSQKKEIVKITPKVSKVNCSREQSGPNVGLPSYAIDGNPLTSWACEGMADITFDLGEEKNISAINVGYNGYRGDGNYIKIYVDGKLVAEGSQIRTYWCNRGRFCPDGNQKWEIEETQGRYITYETIRKPYRLEKDLEGYSYNAYQRSNLATFTELSEITVDTY